ncbi:hypothetical protein CVT24_009873 [Panaeolus cyanescens]|uniref:Uncharacterized protein n=1 Tax=Panaeolus cyanescens TaxID=181874 RepID=A0A409VXU2_9AGAR|nr:hypothetical protein CVT24_009873 [Panaeolus cyanescens]
MATHAQQVSAAMAFLRRQYSELDPKVFVADDGQCFGKIRQITDIALGARNIYKHDFMSAFKILFIWNSIMHDVYTGQSYRGNMTQEEKIQRTLTMQERKNFMKALLRALLYNKQQFQEWVRFESHMHPVLIQALRKHHGPSNVAMSDREMLDAYKVYYTCGMSYSAASTYGKLYEQVAGNPRVLLDSDDVEIKNNLDFVLAEYEATHDKYHIDPVERRRVGELQQAWVERHYAEIVQVVTTFPLFA